MEDTLMDMKEVDLWGKGRENRGMMCVGMLHVGPSFYTSTNIKRAFIIGLQ
jgi:hypothetical protein